MPAYPNGRCYCGCGTELSDRTSFWARGHDRAALQRVVREHYSTVADFVVAHDRVRDDLAHLERLLGPRAMTTSRPAAIPGRPSNGMSCAAAPQRSTTTSTPVCGVAPGRRCSSRDRSCRRTTG